jgi:RNA polymerase sigma-70 factor (ECF subfamily)
MNWHGIDLNWAYADLLNGIRHSTGCPHRSYDVLHDSLVRFALIKKRKLIEQPHAYLRTVVKTVLADVFREQRLFRAPLPDDDNPNQDNNLPVDTAPSPETLALLHERLSATQRLLDCMPPRRREVFWLFRVEGYTQREIANRLGVAAKTVENHVMHALIDIRAAAERLA